jgi:hypothetical protein
MISYEPTPKEHQPFCTGITRVAQLVSLSRSFSSCLASASCTLPGTDPLWGPVETAALIRHVGLIAKV